MVVGGFINIGIEAQPCQALVTTGLIPNPRMEVNREKKKKGPCDVATAACVTEASTTYFPCSDDSLPPRDSARYLYEHGKSDAQELHLRPD